jgi:hypothetical protein
VITNISQAKEFIKILSQFLYPSSANPIKDHWDAAFKREKLRGCHCVHLETPKAIPFIFTEATVDRLEGKKIIPVLEGHQCFCTKTGCEVPHHQTSKLLAGSLAINIYEIDSGCQDIRTLTKDKQNKPVMRIHLDRRNEFQDTCLCDFSLYNQPPTPLPNIQPGPLFHIQWGGKSALDYRIDVPRIPSFPMDFVLATDLILRNFYQRQQIAKIIDGKVWKAWVKDSLESLVLSWGEKVKRWLDDREMSFWASTDEKRS